MLSPTEIANIKAELENLENALRNCNDGSHSESDRGLDIGSEADISVRTGQKCCAERLSLDQPVPAKPS
jgi:hypothetical protein